MITLTEKFLRSNIVVATDVINSGLAQSGFGAKHERWKRHKFVIQFIFLIHNKSNRFIGVYVLWHQQKMETSKLDDWFGIAPGVEPAPLRAVRLLLWLPACCSLWRKNLQKLFMSVSWKLNVCVSHPCCCTPSNSIQRPILQRGLLDM